VRFLLIHNEYSAPSGEDVQFQQIVRVLAEHGHDLRCYVRSSAEIRSAALGRTRAFFSGILSRQSRHAVRTLIATLRPDVVFVQNLFPLISPSILPICRQMGCPSIMRVANYRLVCPNGLHFSHGHVCERCLGGREYWCLLRNCEESLPKSAGYALRSAVARWIGWYNNNVSAYICATQFLKSRLVAEGFEESRVHVIPNIVYDVESPNGPPASNSYVAYVGRISREKGIPLILKAAELCPEIPFRLVGTVRAGFRLPSSQPSNVEFLGPKYGTDLASLYVGARLTVIASQCFETFGMSVAESMLHRRPVVVPRHGVFPEFVRDEETGALFEPGSAADLAEKIRCLWNNPEICISMGQAGRRDVLARSNPETYYRAFMEVCEKVAVFARDGATRPLPVSSGYFE